MISFNDTPSISILLHMQNPIQFLNSNSDQRTILAFTTEKTVKAPDLKQSVEFVTHTFIFLHQFAIYFLELQPIWDLRHVCVIMHTVLQYLATLDKLSVTSF